METEHKYYGWFERFKVRRTLKKKFGLSRGELNGYLKLLVKSDSRLTNDDALEIMLNVHCGGEKCQYGLYGTHNCNVHMALRRNWSDEQREKGRQ